MLTDCSQFCKSIISELKSQLARKQKIISKLENENKTFLQHLDNANKKVQEQQDQIRLYKIKFESLYKNTQSLQNQNEYLKKETNVKADVLNEYKKSDKKDKFKQYEKIIAQLQEDIQKLADCIEEHKFVRIENAKEIMDLQKQILEMQSETVQYPQTPQAPLTPKVEYIQVQCDCKQQYQEQISQLTSELELQALTNKELNKSLKKAQNGSQFLIKKFTNLCQQVYDESLQLLAKSNQVDKDQIVQIIQRLRGAQKEASLDIAIIDVEINQENTDMINAKVENLEVENKQIKQKFDSTSSNKEALLMREKDLLSQISKLERQVDHLKDLNQTKQKTLSEQIFALQRTNRQLTVENEKLSREYKEISTQLESYIQTAERQERKIQALQLTLYKQ
ncbi:hypothetical protein pb186bvf_018702 [Paramecium bursaria]